MDYRTRSRVLKLALTIVIVVGMIFAAMMWLLTYHEEGETNIPFKISKITIVSSTDATQDNNSQSEWALNVNQNNDIYLYIDKNKNYGKTELIENVKISNFNITKETEKGEIKIYKQTTAEDKLFSNTPEFEINEIIYSGDVKSNVKQLKISNQGDLIIIRCANNNISQYYANDVTEVNYNQLLQMTNVAEEDLKINISFDLEIKVLNKKTYQTTVELDLPVDGVIAKGKTHKEITDLENIVFKII